MYKSLPAAKRNEPGKVEQGKLFSTLPVRDNNYESAPHDRRNKSYESRNSEDFNEDEHDESVAENSQMNQSL